MTKRKTKQHDRIKDKQQETCFKNSKIITKMSLFSSSYSGSFPPGPIGIIYEGAGFPLPPLNSEQSVSN